MRCRQNTAYCTAFPASKAEIHATPFRTFKFIYRDQGQAAPWEWVGPTIFADREKPRIFWGCRCHSC